MDPRNPSPPTGDDGSTWACCVDCGRIAHEAALISHRKQCPTRRPNYAAAREALDRRIEAALKRALPSPSDDPNWRPLHGSYGGSAID
jgi:hypothetical protein